MLFKDSTRPEKIGKLALDYEWEHLFLILYNGDYQPEEIWDISKEVLSQHLQQQYSVHALQKIGKQIWPISPFGVIHTKVSP